MGLTHGNPQPNGRCCNGCYSVVPSACFESLVALDRESRPPPPPPLVRHAPCSPSPLPRLAPCSLWPLPDTPPRTRGWSPSNPTRFFSVTYGTNVWRDTIVRTAGARNTSARRKLTFTKTKAYYSSYEHTLTNTKHSHYSGGVFRKR